MEGLRGLLGRPLGPGASDLQPLGDGTDDAAWLHGIAAGADPTARVSRGLHAPPGCRATRAVPAQERRVTVAPV